MLTVASTLAGVVVGFVLNALANWWTQRRRQDEERRGIRMLLRLENHQNLAALSQFWTTVTTDTLVHGVGYRPEELEFGKRQRLGTDTLSAWGHLMWKSQASLLADALSSDEIKQVYELHTALDTFTAVRAKLRDVFNSPEGQKLTADYANWIEVKRLHQDDVSRQYEADMWRALTDFNDRTRPLWNECQDISNRLRAYENLLQ